MRITEDLEDTSNESMNAGRFLSCRKVFIVWKGLLKEYESDKVLCCQSCSFARQTTNLANRQQYESEWGRHACSHVKPSHGFVRV